MTLNKDPQTATKMKMIAKYCACCSKPLCDAKSVEIGIGPVCRKQHGYGYCDDLTEAQRKEANELIYKIAIDQTGPEVVAAAEKLFDLGFSKLVARIMQRIAQIVIAIEEDGRIAVKSPYNWNAVGAMQKIPGRHWDKQRKVNTFPATQKAAVYEILKKFYAGKNAVGPKGPFVVGQVQKTEVVAKFKAEAANDEPVNPFTTAQSALMFISDAEYALGCEDSHPEFSMTQLREFAEAKLAEAISGVA